MPIRRRLGEASNGKRTAAFTLVAALAAAPLVAIGGGAAINLIDNQDSGPVQAAIDNVSVADGSDVMVDDARIATKALADEANPTRGLVKEMRRDEEFSMFALTWDGEDSEAAAYFRAERPDGTWSKWYDADPENSAGESTDGINGTEPIYVEPTKAIQFTTVGLGIFEDGAGRAADAVNAFIESTATEIEDAIDGYIPGGAGSVGDVSEGLQGSVSESAEGAGSTGGTVPKSEVDPQGTDEDKDDTLKGTAYDDPSQIPDEDEYLTIEERDAQREEQAEAQPEASEDGANGRSTENPADEAGAGSTEGADTGSLGAGSSGETGSLGLIDASNIKAVFIDGNVGDDETIAPIAENKDLSGMPNVVSRSGWGADESIRCGSPTNDGSIKAVTVHHTAGSNNYDRSQANGIMRGIYTYHAQTRGWCDVGYNALVDKFGTIYEGRAGGLDKAIQGAHAGGFNKDTWGISMMGDYSREAPSDATLESMSKMIGWRMSVDDVDPLSDTTLTATGFSGSKFPRGANVPLPAIFAHRDVGNTTCPGDVGYSHMDDMREGAKAEYDRIKGGGVGALGLGGGGVGTQTNGDGSNNSNGGTDDSEDAEESDNSGSGSAGSSGSASGSSSILADVLTSLGAPNLGTTISGIASALDNPDRPFTIEDIPVLVNAIIQANEDGNFSEEWNNVLANFGAVLGDAETGVQEGADVNTTQAAATDDEDKNVPANADRLEYVKFEHGIITSSEATGTNAIWGPIAEAWAEQGYDVGELGAPTSTVTQDGDIFTAEFQGGTITFNESTGEINVDLND